MMTDKIIAENKHVYTRVVVSNLCTRDAYDDRYSTGEIKS